MTDSSNISTVSPGRKCECYKKLHLLGVPLYIRDENEAYSENHEVLGYEKAFRLPGILKIDESCMEYPLVAKNELSYVFERMAQIIPNVADFELNLLSFWIMDMFIEGLSTAQSAELPHEHQKAMLLWIAYFFNYILKNNPTRKEMFKHLKTLLFFPEEPDSTESDFIDEEHSGEGNKKDVEFPRGKGDSFTPGKKVWELPLPPQLDDGIQDDGTSEQELTPEDIDAGEAKSSQSSTAELRQNESLSERNVRHMKVILEILYRIFGNLWVFMEIQTAFHAMPTLEKIDIPFTLNIPKPRLKPETSQLKFFKNGKKGSEQLTEKCFEEFDFDQNLHKNDYILPLQASDEAKIVSKQLFGQLQSDSSLPGKGKKK